MKFSRFSLLFQISYLKPQNTSANNQNFNQIVFKLKKFLKKYHFHQSDWDQANFILFINRLIQLSVIQLSGGHLALVYFSGPKIYFTKKFGNFSKTSSGITF